MTTWVVTMMTGDNRWTEITVEAVTHDEAIRTAARLVGGTFVSVV